jgi:hypothetical protein
MDGVLADTAKAARHEAIAANVGEALARSIFGDDPDAIDALRERVATMEGTRERRKAVQSAWKRAGRPSAVDVVGWGCVADALGCAVNDLTEARENARFTDGQGPYPAYSISNIGAEIRRNRQRLDRLTAGASEQAAT